MMTKNGCELTSSVGDKKRLKFKTFFVFWLWCLQVNVKGSDLRGWARIGGGGGGGGGGEGNRNPENE